MGIRCFLSQHKYETRLSNFRKNPKPYQQTNNQPTTRKPNKITKKSQLTANFKTGNRYYVELSLQKVLRIYDLEMTS